VRTGGYRDPAALSGQMERFGQGVTIAADFVGDGF
jgi:hypothetical protein